MGYKNMKRRLKRVALVLITLEIIYLVVINLALNLPVTQTLINQVKPDKFAIYWSSAWSLYPFRVNVRGVSANGQIPSQQWQVDAPAASGTISILPLIGRTVNVRNVEVKDVVYHQRPRPKPDKDYAKIRRFFPVIKDRQPEETYNSAAKMPKPKGKRWKINLYDAHAKGDHRIWIYQMQAVFTGDVSADVAAQTRRGPFALPEGKFDVALKSLLVNGNPAINKQGHLKGTVAFSPFVPSQNRGIKSLAFLTLDADIRSETNSLAFMNFYLGRFMGMKVDGAGKLEGHLRLEKAKLQPGSRLSATARELSVDLLAHRAEGAGKILVHVGPKAPATTNVSIAFESLTAFPPESREPLFVGEGLGIAGKGNITLLPIDGRKSTASYLSVTIPSVRVPDLRVYQRYLPEKWALKLNGGEGKLWCEAELSEQQLGAKLKLDSDDADVGLKEYRFKSNLDVELNANSPSITSAGVDVSGSTIRLSEAKLSNEDRRQSEPWYASLEIKKGVIKLPSPEAEENQDIKQLFRNLDGKELFTGMYTGDEALKLIGSISDLQWLTLLLKNPYKMAIHGTGEIEADVYLAAGWPEKGTLVTILPRNLSVDVLDYVTEGEGRVTLAVEKGGEHPDLNLNVTLDDAFFMRHGEEKAFIDKVAIRLQAMVRNMNFDNPDDNVSLLLKIPSARVKDMSVYNQYLPDQSAIRLLGGEAGLTADIELEPEAADGYVKLQTKRLRSRINDQEISGELTADVKLAGGVPKKMEFDISGSTLSLDNVSVAGKQKNFEDESWHARLDLRNGYAEWNKPTRVAVDAAVTMNDTRPLAAILSNQRGKHGWLEKVLTVDDVHGQAQMIVAQKRIVISRAFAESDDIDVGAKGIIDARTREGVFYVRFKKMAGILKIRDGDRNFDILNARKKFDAYSNDNEK